MFFWTNWNRANRALDLEPAYTEVVTAERYIQLYEEERDDIESVHIIPGRLGTNDFGRFVVRRKRPIYTSIFSDPIFER